MLKSVITVVAAFGVLTGAAQAQNYPNKPVRFISAYAPGGGQEVGLRVIATRMTDAGWPQIVVENKPGGSGVLAAQTMLQAPADGYTVLQCDVTVLALNPSLIKDLAYDPQKDFAPVTMTFSFPSVLVVPANSPAKTIDDLINTAKTKPGGLNYASQGVGSGGHLLGTMFQNSLGKPQTHVPYKGSAAALPDVIAGRVDMLFSSFASAKGHIESGAVRALAVTSKKRMNELPNIPTMTEAKYPDVFFDVWSGLCVPAATPPAVIAAIRAKAVEVLQQPDTIKRMSDAGLYAETSASPDEFRALVKSDIDRLGKVIKDAGVTPQ